MFHQSWFDVKRIRIEHPPAKCFCIPHAPSHTQVTLFLLIWSATDLAREACPPHQDHRKPTPDHAWIKAATISNPMQKS